jgi:Rieske Fe-S protein
MITRLRLFLFLTLPFLAGCSDDDDAQRPYIPDVYVNQQLNLTNIQYSPLRQDRGFVYLNAGARGIIVVRQSATRYLAFEQTCTYQSIDTCAVVKVDNSRLFMKDKCCGSQFDFEGAVISGPAAFPLKQYQTALSGNMLHITN